MAALRNKPVVPDTALLELQKKIYGQRNDKLSPVEVNKLFQLPVNPEFILSIYQGLRREAIDPNVAVIQAIPRAVNKEYIIPIALCLRSGADANLYVNAPKIGTIHILGYIYSSLAADRFSDIGSSADDDIINTIVLMFVANNSRPSLPMFDRNAGKLRTEGEPQATSLTVAEWLNDQGYTTILDRIGTGDPSELQRVVDKESLTMLSIMLDMPSLAGREYVSSDMHLAIRSHSTTCFDTIPTPDTRIGMDFKSLVDAVTHLNSRAFDKLIKRGQLPSYLLVNKILVAMRKYRELNHIMPMQELEAMLLSSVAVGVQLDRDQLAMVSIMGKDLLESVNKEYDQPYWRKVCKVPNSTGVTPEPLRRLAISLNIDPTMSQTAICDSINVLSKADKEALKAAAHRRQQIRMAGDLGFMNEYLDGKIPTLVCRNRSVLPNAPEDYNDIDLAYYRDDQGAVWCFGSDSFATVLESGVNPYNSTKLPESFKEQLQYQINVLKRLGVDASQGEVGIYTSRIPITFSSSIDSLTSKDIVNERSSAQSFDALIQLGNRNGISADTIKNLSKQDMTNALRSVDYEVDFQEMSTSHALVTTSRIVEYLNKTKPDAVANFFSSLNLGHNI